MQATSQIVTLEVKGMTCASCAEHVKRALKNVKGILAVELPDWSKGQATVVTAGTKEDALVKAIQDAGYQAQALTQHSLEKNTEDNLKHGITHGGHCCC